MHRGGCLELYYCNMGEWFWWDLSLILTTSWFLSVLWHCWFGHLACKCRPEMTYNLLSGTFSLYATALSVCNIWPYLFMRIVFKTAVTVYECLNGLAPLYLTEYCKSTTPDAGHRHLRSANTCQLIIPRTSTSYGDRSFTVHGPVIWNHLPHDLQSTDISLTTFRKRLKTFMFDADT